MRFPRTLYTYVLREVLQYTLLGFLGFAGILVSQNLLRRLDDLVAVGFELTDLFAVLGCIMGMLAAYIVPVSFLFGVLLAVGRLSSDSEVMAMRTCGMGIRHLVAPVLVLSAFISLITAAMMLEVEPSSRRELRGVLKSIASKGAILEPGRFREFGDRVLYVDDRDLDNRLKGIVVSDQDESGKAFTVFAESGEFRFDEAESMILLRLHNGDIHLQPSQVGADRYRRISFRDFDYSFDVSGLLATDERTERPREMSMQRLTGLVSALRRGEELSEDLHEKDPNVYFLQFHRRLALPVAPLLFALVGTPLGLRRTRGARSFGALLCVALVFSYYALLSFAEYLGKSGSLPIGAALWMPNVAFFAVGLFLLARARRAGA